MDLIKSLLGVVLAMGLTTASRVQAKTVFVDTVTGAASTEEKTSVLELVRIALMEEGQHKVVDASPNAQVTLKPNLLKLGDSVVLSIQKQEKGRPDFAVKMKALTMGEMDTVATRVVRAVMREQTLDDSATVKDITQGEEHLNTRRYQATRQWQFGIGPAWSHGLNTSKDGVVWDLGYTWGLDPHYDVNLNWSNYLGRGSDNDARMSSLSIGVNYLVSLTKHTPFLYAGLGYGSGTAEDVCSTWSFGCTGNTLADRDASGWLVSAGAGYRFFRTSSVNLGLEAKYSYLFDKTSDGTPGVFSTRIVVYY